MPHPESFAEAIEQALTLIPAHQLDPKEREWMQTTLKAKYKKHEAVINNLDPPKERLLVENMMNEVTLMTHMSYPNQCLGLAVMWLLFGHFSGVLGALSAQDEDWQLKGDQLKVWLEDNFSTKE